jgi:hypothetical protein
VAAGKLETQAPVAHAPVRNMRLPGNGLCHSHNVANLAQTQRRQACLTSVRHVCLSLLVFVGGQVCEERCMRRIPMLSRYWTRIAHRHTQAVPLFGLLLVFRIQFG